MPRDSAMPETTTGPWSPRWSPGHIRPGLPPLTVVHDPRDDHAFMAAALAAHAPALGRITVHPTPVASAPAALAHDLLRSLDKHLPLAGSEDGTYWTTNTETAWRVVAAWILALRIGHVIVTRTHRVSSRHFEYLFALRELTGIRLTLLCHGPLPPTLTAALAALAHHQVHTPDAARRAVSVSAPRPPAHRWAWWEAEGQFPPRADEPCFLLPTRRTVGRRRIEAAARRLGRTVLPLPAARCPPLAVSRPSPMSTPPSSRTGSIRASPIPSTPRRWRYGSSAATRPHTSGNCPPPARTVAGSCEHRPGQRT
ncbi:hypothetical protein ABZ746_34145 [Streptomyces sp. NPDC020096]